MNKDQLNTIINRVKAFVPDNASGEDYFNTLVSTVLLLTAEGRKVDNFNPQQLNLVF